MRRHPTLSQKCNKWGQQSSYSVNGRALRSYTPRFDPVGGCSDSEARYLLETNINPIADDSRRARTFAPQTLSTPSRAFDADGARPSANAQPTRAQLPVNARARD